MHGQVSILEATWLRSTERDSPPHLLWGASCAVVAVAAAVVSSVSKIGRSSTSESVNSMQCKIEQAKLLSVEKWGLKPENLCETNPRFILQMGQTQTRKEVTTMTRRRTRTGTRMPTPMVTTMAMTTSMIVYSEAVCVHGVRFIDQQRWSLTPQDSSASLHDSSSHRFWGDLC